MTEQRDQADFLEALVRRISSLEGRIALYERQNLEALLGPGLPGRSGGIGTMPAPPAVGGGPITPAAVIPPGAVGPGIIAPGAIVDLTPFASSIRPILLVSGTLPTLPDADYPVDTFVYKTDDVPPRLYKNVADVWVAAVGPDDIQADSITAGQIAAGAISATEIAAGAITVEKLALEDESGQTLLDAGGFGPTWRRFIQSGVYNGDFASPTPSTAVDVDNTTNPLPYWTYSQVSGTAITARVVADADAAGGFAVRFSMAAGAAGDRSYISQVAPINPSRSGDFVVHVRATFRATADSVARASLRTFFLDKTLGILTSVVTASETLTTINADPENIKVLSATHSGDEVPSDAAYVFVQTGLERDVAGTGATASADLLDVRVENPRGDIRLADNEVASNVHADIFKASGRLWLRVLGGDNYPAIAVEDDGDIRLLTPDAGRVWIERESGEEIPLDTGVATGVQPSAFPMGYSASLAMSGSAGLDAVSGGLGGARAIPIVVTARMLASAVYFYNTDTTLFRAVECRLYRDVGAAAMVEVPGSAGSTSFTSSGATVRGIDFASPIDLGPGLYWLVMRCNTSLRTISIGFTATSNVMAPTANFSTSGTAALGSTIDITGWTESSAIFAVILVGLPFDGSTDWGVVP